MSHQFNSIAIVRDSIWARMQHDRGSVMGKTVVPSVQGDSVNRANFSKMFDVRTSARVAFCCLRNHLGRKREE